MAPSAQRSASDYAKATPDNKQIRSLKRVRSTLSAAFSVIAIATVAIVIPSIVPDDAKTQALIARPRATTPWAVIEEEGVMSGATIAADTYVVFHVPFGVERISREILFGQRGHDVRYWGYCYPENDDPTIVKKRTGLKGLLFLSEKERKVRADEAYLNRTQFSLKNLPTKEDLLHAAARPTTPIKHQIDFFKGGQLCFIMTEIELPIGLDDDGDRLNTRLERDLGTDPLIDDTDGDGILDGIEYKYGTDPTLRDTDGDGIIDGIEDANWNGLIDFGETDPRSIDFDRDGLCDGQCRKKLSNGQILYVGEDRNLNGVVDEGETDPRLKDTDGDGTSDLMEYLVCLTEGKRACK